MRGLHRLETALGPLQVAFDGDGALIYLGFADHESRSSVLAKVARLGPVDAAPGRALVDQLAAYAEGWRGPFTVPLRLHGTPFELRVWRQLLEIPWGETRSYGDLARRLGGVSLSRAVGRANGANPVSILVPCHRVVGVDGSLTGYAGGLAMKARLLRLEGGLA